MTISEKEIRKRINRILESVNQIEGWLTYEGMENLYSLALKAPVPNIVEIGSWKGKSTSCLAYAIKERGEGRVYAIDTWNGTGSESEMLQSMLKKYAADQLYNEFIENMTRLKLMKYIKPIQMDSIEASCKWPSSRSIGLLYIDASHDYLSVMRDFEFWGRFVISRGYIVFDDVPSWPGPTKLINQLPRWYKKVDIKGNHAIFQKVT